MKADTTMPTLTNAARKPLGKPLTSKCFRDEIDEDARLGRHLPPAPAHSGTCRGGAWTGLPPPISVCAIVIIAACQISVVILLNLPLLAGCFGLVRKFPPVRAIL